MVPDMDDNDFLDGCALDFSEDPDDDLTAELRPLFPDGDPSTADEWKVLLDGPAPPS